MKKKYTVEYGEEWHPKPMSNRRFLFYVVMTIAVVAYSVMR